MLGGVDDIRTAIVGYGLAGGVLHAPLIELTPGMSVSTVVTRNPGRAEQARRAHPGVRVVESADELWERPEEHDLVVIASPNESHAPLGRAAVDAGLPVVVDKPLALNAAEARELVDHAERAAVMLTVFQNRRWDSDQMTLKRLMADGRLGDVVRYESRFERWRPELSDDAWRDRLTAERGGGVLLDLGSHLIDQALTLFGPVSRVHGEVARRRGGPADDDAFVALEHESGVHSHLWASSVAPAPGPRLRVQGSRAGFVVEGLDSQEDSLKSGRPLGDGWGSEPESNWGRLMRGDESEAVPSEPGAWPEFYAGVANAVRGGGAPPVDPRDAVSTLEIIEAARG
jgi:predicted dehydrogenase